MTKTIEEVLPHFVGYKVDVEGVIEGVRSLNGELYIAVRFPGDLMVLLPYLNGKHITVKGEAATENQV